MSVPSRLAAPLLLVAVLSAAAGGVLLGVRLGERASEPDVRQLEFIDPLQLEGTPPYAARSAGGFTGFGGPPALLGEVLRSGVVTEVEERALTIADAASTLRVSYGTPVLVFRLAAASAPLAVGDTVLVRLVDGTPTGVLRIAAPVTEGGTVATP